MSTHIDSSINLINRPAARINHGFTGTIQMPSETWITIVHVDGQRIATIQFHVIYIPFGKLLGIVCLVANNAWVSSTSVITKVLINTKLQTSSMNLQLKQSKTFYWYHSKSLYEKIICAEINCIHSPIRLRRMMIVWAHRDGATTYIIAKRFHATRKTFPIGHQFAPGSPWLFQPAIVHIDIFITDGCIAFRYHQIRHCSE